MELIKLNDVNNKIITIRNENVILDSDVAELYGVKTKHINQAVQNNPDKFPEGYVFQLKVNEFKDLREKFLSKKLKRIDNQDVVTICDHIEYTPSVAVFDKQLPDNQGVVKIFDHPLIISNFSPTLPKAFTERGLYMLATILKSPQATQTTLAIVETFTKIRELSRSVVELVEDPENEQKQGTIMQKSGDILREIIGNDLQTTNTETSFELNLLAAVKFKHTVKRGRKPKPPEQKR